MNNNDSNTKNDDDLATGLNSFFNQVHLLVDDVSTLVQDALGVSIKEATDKDLNEFIFEALDTMFNQDNRGNDWWQTHEDALDWREFLEGLNLGDSTESKSDDDIFSKTFTEQEFDSACDYLEFMSENCDFGEDLGDDFDTQADDETWEHGYNAGYLDAKFEYCGEINNYDRGRSDAVEEMLKMYVDELFVVFFGKNNNRAKSEDTVKFDQETESELKELISNFLFEKFGSDELND